MIGSFLVSLAALVIAVVGSVWMQPNDVRRTRPNSRVTEEYLASFDEQLGRDQTDATIDLWRIGV